MAASIKRIGQLKQQVYRDFACGLSLSESLPDRDAPYWSMASSFSGDRPADADAQAQALVRLLQDDKIEAWLYRFGLPDLFVHTGVIAVSDVGPVFCDPFTGLFFEEPFTVVLDQLDQGVAPRAQPLGKDRKVCVLDTEADPHEVVERLAKRAERELVGGGGQRAFLLNWTADLFAECSSELSAALGALKSAGAAQGFAELLLYPIEVARGEEAHADIAQMPVVGSWFAARQASGAAAQRAARTAGAIEAARVAALGRLVNELRRDLDSVRRAPREPAGRFGLGRVDRAAPELKITQDALRRAGADLAEARGMLLTAQADADRLRFEVERLTRAGDGYAEARSAFLAAQADADRLKFEVERLARERDGAVAEAADLKHQVERLEQRLEQLRGAAEDAARETSEARAVIDELENTLAANLNDRAADVRRFEEERKLLLVAQARLEREVQAVRGELNSRAQETEALARSVIQLAYAPAPGQALAAPNAGMAAEAAERIGRRIAELEHAKVAAETELHNHRVMLANSRYMRTRAALSRLLRGAR